MLTYPTSMMLKAYINGLWVRGTGSSDCHEVLGSWLLGRAHGYGVGKEKEGVFTSAFLLPRAGG